jgi:quinol monooxygenase YgiN
MIVVAGKFTVKPERRADMVRLAGALFAPSRAEAGCLTYNCYQQADDPNAFLFFEEWESQAAIDRHFETPHFKRFMTDFPGMIVGKPVIKLYQTSQIKEL